MTKKITGVYVLGTGRSGTTMMEKLIASHPDIAGVMETEILKKYSHKFENIDDLIKEVSVSEKEYKIVSKYFKENIKYKKVKRVDPYRFMYDFCLAHADHHKKKFYVEKSPIHSLFAREIIRKIPNSKIVIILRDPRSTIFSKNYANTANRGKQYHFPKFLRHQFNMSETLFTYRYFDKLYKRYKNSDKIMFINYEKLVKNPKKELTRMFKFIGVKYFPVDEKFGPNDLRLEGRGKLKIKMNSSFKEKKKQSKSILSAGSVDRWKKGLSKEEIKTINRNFYLAAPAISKDFFPDIPKAKGNLKSAYLYGFSEVDKKLFQIKNIGKLSKARIYKC